MATKASGKRRAVKSKSGNKKRNTKTTTAAARTKNKVSKRTTAAKSRKLPVTKAVTKSAKKKPSRKSATKPALVSTAMARPIKSVPKSPLLLLVEKALSDMKAVNVTILDVRGLTDVADSMVIASGNSDRHVKSIADNVVMEAKRAGFRPMGVEGERDGEWALVDLQDVVVHVMLPRVREFYRLENLWDISAARRESNAATA
jgi:ribosome-associated protein